jgi:hypothetical protein
MIVRVIHPNKLSQFQMDRSSRSTVTLSIPWTDIQRQRCITITQKLINAPISLYFRTPVDPVRDAAPGYHDKVKKPMDLGTVLQKLCDGKYASLERWKEDVAQIWKNANLYNGDGSLVDSLARELNDLFKHYCESIPKSDSEKWLFSLRKSQAKLERYIQARPVPVDAAAQLATPRLKLRVKPKP